MPLHDWETSMGGVRLGDGVARGAKHAEDGGRRHGEFLEGLFAEEAFALRQTLQMFFEKEGVCLWRGAPPRDNLRASFLRALRVWRRQRWRGGARGAKHGGNGGRRHGEFLGGEFMGGSSNLEWTILEKEGRKFVCGAEHPSRNNLRASFLRALRVWRRQRWLLAVGSFQQ